MVLAPSSLPSKALIASGRLHEARTALDAALQLPGVRAALTSREQRERLAKKGMEPSTHERASVFLLLAEVHSKLWQRTQGGGGGGGASEKGGAAGPAGAACPEASKVREGVADCAAGLT